MQNVTVQRSTDGCLIPTNTFDRQQIIDGLKDGEFYQVKITKPRNVKHHRKYWALMNALSFHFGSTSEFWHLDCKNAFLPKEQRINKITGEVIEYLPSTSFEKLDQMAFDVYYKQIDMHLLSLGYNLEELISTM